MPQQQLSNSNQNSDEEQLKRFLTHISYTGMGVDKQLDTLLSRLRKTIKDGSLEQIRQSVDEITSHLRDIEEQTIEVKGSSEQAQASSPKYLLESLLNSLLKEKLDRSLKSKIRTLLADAPDLDEQSMVMAIQALFSEAVNKPQKQGFWSRLFSAPTPVEAEAETDDTDEQSLNPKAELPSSLIDALNCFVDQLGVIDIYKEATKHIRTQIENITTYYELSPVIEEIASALLEAANQEHIQFESFLKLLNKRLLHIASFLNQSAVGHKELMSDTDKLDVEIKEHLEVLQSDIASSSDLETLKDKVVTSFGYISDSINRFKETQNKRVEASVAELKLVQEQLEVTEDEAIRLKENLIEQRFRAHTDPLTQLPNRYAYNERLSQEYSRWRRYRSPLSLAIGDIDLFKKINDEYGHEAGDQVLKFTSEILLNGIRESDFVARFGGEEFVLLMPETGLVDATKAINKLRQTIGGEEIPLQQGKTINTTFSFGVAEFEGSDTAQDVFKRADKALYRAKQKGRNQVCCERA